LNPQRVGPPHARGARSTDVFLEPTLFAPHTFIALFRRLGGGL
jgi:hypothetical protein